MVPYIPIPTVKGGSSEIVRLHNEARDGDLCNPYCMGTYPKITEKNVKVLEHLVLECGEGMLLLGAVPDASFEGMAREKGADAIINYSVEVKHKGHWIWKKPTYIKISGDAVKIEYDKGEK